MLRRLHLDGWVCVLAALLALGCGASDEASSDFTSNPSFDDWCDRNLCDWTTTRGRIEQASTWHDEDLGVSFVETPTEISQLLDLSAERATCLLFDTIADVVPSAEVSILMDFNDDGIQDDEQKIPAVRWKSVQFVVRTPVAYEGMRLNVIKRGEGRAVLALMRVVSQSNCTPLTLRDGSKCSQDAVCVSGLCQEGRCTSLTPGASSE